MAAGGGTSIATDELEDDFADGDVEAGAKLDERSTSAATGGSCCGSPTKSARTAKRNNNKNMGQR